MHLHQNATQGPHVDSQIVRHSEQDLRRTVESALNVLIDLRSRRKRQWSLKKKTTLIILLKLNLLIGDLFIKLLNVYFAVLNRIDNIDELF